MKITKELLQAWEFPRQDINAFADIFPEGTYITRESLEIMANACINIADLMQPFLIETSDMWQSENEMRPYFTERQTKVGSVLLAHSTERDRTYEFPVHIGTGLREKIASSFEQAVLKIDIDYYLKILPIVHKWLKEYKLTKD